MACLSEAATPKIGIKFCACVGWRRLLYKSVEQRRDSACQCRGSVLEKGAGWAISGLRSVAHAHDTYGVCTMPTVHVHHLAVYLRWFTDDWAPADTRAWLRIFEQEVDSRQPTDWRGCRKKWRGDRLEMYGHGRLPTLTDAYRRLPTLIPGCSFRVWQCQSVPQCDWTFSSVSCWSLDVREISRSVTASSTDTRHWRESRLKPWRSKSVLNLK